MYYSDVAGRWRCNKCNAVYTKDMIFICYDPELKITVNYNKDGNIKKISPIGDMTLYEDVIERQKQHNEYIEQIINANLWWSILPDEKKVVIWKKNKK